MANFIKKAVSKNPGGLHKSLGVKAGKKISAKKMAKAAKSKNPLIKKQLVLAKTLKKISKNRKGKK